MGAGAEHEGGDGAKPASSAHPRRAPPPRIPAGMPGFDGRGGGSQARVGSTRKCLRWAERAPPHLIPRGGRLIGALRFLFPPRWLSQRERAARTALLLVLAAPAMGLIDRDIWLNHSAGPLRGAPPLESFTGVIGRADLDQGRGVLSRVTSASMLLSVSMLGVARTCF